MLNNTMAKLDFYDIDILNQKWSSESYFSYLEKQRPYHGICFVISGEIKYKTPTAEFTAIPGDVVILKKSSRYKAVFKECDTHDILINFQCVDKDGRDFFDFCEDSIIIYNSRIDMQKIFNQIFRYHIENNRHCMVKSKLYEIIDEICKSEVTDPFFAHIKQTIDNDTDFSLTESDIAKECMTSISTLQRTFKKNYGKTISEYKNELKISKAKELLDAKSHSVGDIAEILGFCDSSHFSKSFKTATGISPKKYSQQH